MPAVPQCLLDVLGDHSFLSERSDRLLRGAFSRCFVAFSLFFRERG
jgi:hypothetical protein